LCLENLIGEKIMIKNKIPVLTSKDKMYLYKLLNRDWIFNVILDSCEDNKKEFKELNGVSIKQAEKLLHKLLDVLVRS